MVKAINQRWAKRAITHPRAKEPAKIHPVLCSPLNVRRLSAGSLRSVCRTDRNMRAVAASSPKRQMAKHRLGSFGDQKVWSTTGLCPCVLTAKRHLFLHDGNIVTPSVATLARLQGLDPTSLPSDDTAARKLVGNSIQRGMHKYVLSRVLQHATLAINTGIPAFRPPAKVAWPEQLKHSKVKLDYSSVTVSDIQDSVPIHALPGVSPGTVDPSDPAPLDLDALEPSVVKEVERWALKVKKILLEQTLAKSWMPTSFPLQPYLPSRIKMHACMEECDFVDPLPTSIPTLESNRRKAALAAQISIIS